MPKEPMPKPARIIKPPANAGRYPVQMTRKLNSSNKQSAKQGTNNGLYRKFKTGTSKLVNTNSPIKASVPLKPSSAKANAAKKTSTSIRAKYNKLNPAPKNVKSSKSGAINKMKAQGNKAVSGPTARAMQFKKKVK